MDNKDEILKLYLNGVSRTNLCHIYGISWNKLTKLLIDNDISLRTVKDNSKKYTCDEDFFELIDDEEKAYWLGFIYADGYITGKKIGIRLSYEDREHLNKFKDSLKSNHKINNYKCSNGFSNILKKSSNICIVSEKMLKDIIKCGVVYNKSLILKFPHFLKHNMIPHFIRGYFDGDGSVSLSTYKRNKNGEKKYIKGVFSIYGTYEFLMEIKNLLPVNFSLYKEKRSNSNTWYLKTGSIKKTYIMNDYFYKNSTIYLNRKMDKFKEIIYKYENK